MDYGAANKFGFDDPQKWHTEYSVPLLDEHQMTDEGGKPVAYVDKNVLQVIADNNNRRVYQTGDPATLILGHTDDDPRAPEKPAKGFVVNYTVKPFKRDPKTGQVIYAIHGDFKVRPKNTYILEEYPRRSVELWWNKKELDPIALLGGTSPERDLGVVVRKARLRHVGLLGGTTPERDMSIQFARYGDDSFECYPIDHVMRLRRTEGVKKYGLSTPSRDDMLKLLGRSDLTPEQHSAAMDKFVELGYHTRAGGAPESRTVGSGFPMPKESTPTKFGEGEKKVRKVLHEFKEGTLHSGSKKGPKVTSRKQAIAIAMSEAGKSKNSRRESMPKRYEHCPPSMDYADESMNTEDITSPNPDPEEPDTDPMIAKVFESKRFKELLQSAVLDAIEQVTGGGEEEGMEGPEGMGPPPGPPTGEGPPMEGPPGGEPPIEEEDRLHHGERPVQFEGPPTSMPGPMNSNIPAFTQGKRSSPVTSYSRNGSHTMNNKDQTIKNLEKKVEELQLRLSRSDARELVLQLKDEGIEFGDTPESRVAGEKDEIEYLAMLNPEEQKYHVNEVIRKRYRRRKANPVNPAIPGVARFARPEVRNGEVQEEGEFVPQDPQEASDFADLLAVRKLSRVDASKEMFKLRRQRDS